MDALRERIANLLDEIVLLPSDEFLTELANAYPETTRSVYRYGKLPIRRVSVTGNLRRLYTQLNFKLISSKLDSLLPEENQYDHRKQDSSRSKE